MFHILARCVKKHLWNSDILSKDAYQWPAPLVNIVLTKDVGHWPASLFKCLSSTGVLWHILLVKTNYIPGLSINVTLAWTMV